MPWTNITRTYATPQGKNAWAHLPDQGWRRIDPNQPDGVTNALILLALARATDREANVIVDESDRITQVYL